MASQIRIRLLGASRVAPPAVVGAASAAAAFLRTRCASVEQNGNILARIPACDFNRACRIESSGSFEGRVEKGANMGCIRMKRRVDARPLGWSMLLASTMLASAGPTLAAEAAATSGGATALSEVVVTAEKREENLQAVPMSIQAIDTKKLTQLNVTNFQDYVKFMPSVQFQTDAPGSTTIYMRGVADGGDANHSGPQPSVGSYLDEQPITTIGGTLDIHIYDIARVEVLPGPQGTLYGASSESGTLKIITNKPSTSGFSGGFDLQGNTVDHGSEGYVAEGFVNIPLTSNVAVRLVAFDERDAGFIDNVAGTRPFATSGETLTNAGYVKNNFNPVETYGGRAALKFDLNDHWSITPSVIAQDQRTTGVFGYNPAVGDLQVQRFQPDSDHDRWVQAAMTINGKIGRFDLTYSGGYFNRKEDSLTDYTDYSVAYDQAYGSGAFWQDKNGDPLPYPQQEIVGHDRFEKGSNELRIASPATDRFRIIAGLFQERQTHWIIQDYQIQGLGPQISVPGWANTIWLTDQNRIDRDEAAFGEATFDITSKLSITGGIRYYHYDNTLVGFYGFGAGYNALTGYSSGEGVDDVNCKPDQSFRNAPCVNLNKTVAQSGETHKVNLTYKIDDEKLVYFTYSTGYRPGGVNRSGNFGPYQADTLANYELGWKTSWLSRSLNFNGAVYDEEWNRFQFAFLGPNSLTIVENAPSARIRGIEASLDWRATERLTIFGGGSYNDAVLTGDFCTNAGGNPVQNCTGLTVLAPKGQQLPYTPKFKGDVTARYAFDVMDWKAHAQASLNYQTMRLPAVFSADLTNLGTMPGFASVDFSVGAERDKTSVELFVKNAFDERGQLNRETPCTTSICAPGYPGVPPAVYVVPIQPLTVGIRIGQKF
jgi:outer membrane receptor protein involved in Fe transport